MKIVLFEPQIPQNTGNVVRTCSVSGTSLVLVKPLGFSISSRHLKRAGLDYWENIEVTLIDDLFSYLKETSCTPYFFSSHAKKPYTDINFKGDELLIFGSETSGLPKIYLENWPDNFYTIPMKNGARCLNLASAAAIVNYEAMRQTNYASLRNMS